MIQTKDIYWLAGLLEGEGAFTQNGSPRYPVINIQMKDRDVVEKVHNLLRSVVYRRGGNTVRGYTRSQLGCPPTEYYMTRITGRRAAGWMMTVYPLMGERRQARIRELLLVWRDCDNPPSEVQATKGNRSSEAS